MNQTPNFAQRGRWAVGKGIVACGHGDTNLSTFVRWRRCAHTWTALERSLSPESANSLAKLLSTVPLLSRLANLCGPSGWLHPPATPGGTAA